MVIDLYGMWKSYVEYLLSNSEINFSVLDVDVMENIKSVAGLHKGAFMDNLQFYIPLLIIFLIAVFASDSFKVFEPIEGLSETFSKVSLLKVVVFGATVFSIHAFYKIIAGFIGGLIAANASVQALSCAGSYINPISIMIYAAALATISLYRGEGTFQGMCLGFAIFVSPTLLSFEDDSAQNISLLVAGVALGITGGIAYSMEKSLHKSIIKIFMPLSIVYFILKMVILYNAEDVMIITSMSTSGKLLDVVACMEMDMILILVFLLVLLIYDQFVEEKKLKDEMSVVTFIIIFSILTAGTVFAELKTNVQAVDQYVYSENEGYAIPSGLGDIVDLSEYCPNLCYDLSVCPGEWLELTLESSENQRRDMYEFREKDDVHAFLRYRIEDDYDLLAFTIEPGDFVDSDDCNSIVYFDLRNPETGETYFSAGFEYDTIEPFYFCADINDAHVVDFVITMPKDKKGTHKKTIRLTDVKLFSTEDVYQNYINPIGENVQEELADLFLINVGSANIREGAGTDYAVITVANNGDTFVATGNELVNEKTGSTWYEIYLDDEQTITGWASEKVGERIVRSSIDSDNTYSVTFLIDKGIEVYWNYVNDSYIDGYTMNYVDYVGGLYLYSIDSLNTDYNYFYCIYNIDLIGIDGVEYNFYYTVRFRNLYINENGELIVDSSDYKTPDNIVYFNSDGYNSYGYESVDSIYEIEIDPLLDSYSYEGIYGWISF